MPQLTAVQIKEVTKHCCDSTDLRLPVRKQEASQDEKAQYLENLLLHDPGVFLERYGKLISGGQREYFQPLREDYEVNFYMMMLEDAERLATQASAAERDGFQKPVPVAAKNRRLAKMTRLEQEGFFEEEASRKRAPLLHHHYLGKYKPARGPVRASTLHDQIIQQHEENQIAEHMARERREEQQAGEAFEATLSESESDDTSGVGSDELEVPIKSGHEPPEGAAVQLSREDMEQNMEDFGALMRARFLSGKDGGADADAESSLDDDWEKERVRDKEDEYFET